LSIVALGRSARNSANVKNKQPLSKAIVCVGRELVLNEELIDLIRFELNVRDVEILHDAYKYVSYELKPQLKTVGPKYGKLLGKIKEKLLLADANALIKDVRAGKNVCFEIDGEKVELAESDLLVKVNNKDGYVSESDGFFTVVLDMLLTEDLIEGGIVREIVSKIQNFRKESGLMVTDHIEICYECAGEVLKVFKNRSKEIASDTLCDKITNGNKGTFKNEFTLNDENVKLYLNKVENFES
ncbi:MAG: DUF5915 domain-containing protein, partial [Clostridia bacterium]